MVLPNQTLVKKGKNANLVGLRQQWPVSLMLATSTEFAEALDLAGWTAEQSAQLKAAGKQIGTVRAATLEVRGNAQFMTKTEAQKRQAAKAVIRVLRNAAPSVLKQLSPEDAAVTQKELLSGNLYDSTPLIVGYLEKVSGTVERLDALFMRFNRKQSLHADVVRVMTELAETDAQQEVAQVGLPAETLAFHEAKGRVLDLIEELNRLSKNAFDGQAHLIGQFNKDLILRATKSRAMPTVEDTEGPVSEKD